MTNKIFIQFPSLLYERTYFNTKILLAWTQGNAATAALYKVLLRSSGAARM